MSALWTASAAMSNTVTVTTLAIPSTATSSDIVVIAACVSDSSRPTYTISSGRTTFTPLLASTAATNSSVVAWICTGLTPSGTIIVTASKVLNGALSATAYSGIGVGTLGAAGVHASSPDSTTVTAPGLTASAANSLIVGAWSSRLGSGTNNLVSVSPGTVDSTFSGGNDATSVAFSSYVAASKTVAAATGAWSAALHNGLGVQAEILQPAVEPTATRFMRIAGVWTPVVMSIRVGGSWITSRETVITGAEVPAGSGTIPLSIPFTIA